MFSLNENKDQIVLIEILEPRLDDDEVKFIKALNDLVLKDNFGLVLNITGDKHFSQNSRKDIGIWFKSNKEVLKKNCFGIVRIKPSEDEELSEKSIAMKKAMPCPYYVKSTIEMAMECLRLP